MRTIACWAAAGLNNVLISLREMNSPLAEREDYIRDSDTGSTPPPPAAAAGSRRSRRRLATAPAPAESHKQRSARRRPQAAEVVTRRATNRRRSPGRPTDQRPRAAAYSSRTLLEPAPRPQSPGADLLGLRAQPSRPTAMPLRRRRRSPRRATPSAVRRWQSPSN